MKSGKNEVLDESGKSIGHIGNGAIIEVQMSLNKLMSSANTKSTHDKIEKLSTESAGYNPEGDQIIHFLNTKRIVALTSTHKFKVNGQSETFQKVTVLEAGASKNFAKLTGKTVFMKLTALIDKKSLQIEGIQVGRNLIQVKNEKQKVLKEEAKREITSVPPVSDEALQKYSASKEVQSAIEFAKKIKRKSSTGRCFRFVKEALLNGGLSDGYIAGKAAKTAGAKLSQLGFVNLLNQKEYQDKITDPYEAPVGAVLVYAGGKYGHVEIRTDDGFVSDYFSPMARTGDKKNGKSGLSRKLVGVYVKM